ncbi:MAG: glycerate kinase [Planctomycetota bacterium]
MSMKIILAPDSFKDSLSAQQVCAAVSHKCSRTNNAAVSGSLKTILIVIFSIPP